MVVTHLLFDEFSPVFSPITIPSGCFMMRGYDTAHPFPSNRPAYFTHDANVAKGYANQVGHSLAFVKTTRPLRLLDVRYMCSVLRIMFESRTKVDHLSNSVIRTVSLAFGLCSLRAQIEQCYARYSGEPALETSINAMTKYLDDAKLKFPVEVPGIRVAETTNDTEAMLFIKQLLKGVDGYISPVQQSAFHVTQRGMAPSELVLFDPLAANVVVVHPRDVVNIQFVKSSLEGGTILSGMSTLNAEKALGMDVVRVTSGGASRTMRQTKVSVAFKKRLQVFDPCGIDRIPDAQYKQMQKNAKVAAKAFVKHRISLSPPSSVGGGVEHHIPSWPRITNPSITRNRNLDSWSDEEYNKMVARVLGEQFVPQVSSPIMHDVSMYDNLETIGGLDAIINHINSFPLPTQATVFSEHAHGTRTLLRVPTAHKGSGGGCI